MKYKTFRPWLQLFLLIFALSSWLIFPAGFVLGSNREPTTPVQLAFAAFVEVLFFPIILLARTGVTLGFGASMFANGLWWTGVCFVLVKLVGKVFRVLRGGSSGAVEAGSTRDKLAAEIRCFECARAVPRAEVVLGDVTIQNNAGEERRCEPFCPECVVVLEAAKVKAAEDEYHRRVGYAILVGLGILVLLAIKSVLHHIR